MTDQVPKTDLRDTTQFHDLYAQALARFAIPAEPTGLNKAVAAAVLMCMSEPAGMTPARLAPFVERAGHLMPPGSTPLEIGMAIGLSLAMITEPEEGE